MQLLKASSSVDTQWSWVTLASLFVISSFTYGIQFVGGVLYSTWIEEFQASRGMMAAITNLPLCIMHLFSPIVPVISTKLKGYRPLMAAGSILMTISLLTSSYARDAHVLLVTHGVCMGVGILFAATPVPLITPLFFKHHNSAAISIVTCSSFLAVLYLSPLLSFFTERYDWRVGFRVLSALLLTTCVPASALIRRHTRQEYNNSGNSNKRSLFTASRTLFKRPHFIILLTALTVQSVDFMVSTTHFVQYAIDLGVEKSRAKTMLPIYYAVGNIVGRLVSGKVFDIMPLQRKLLYYKTMLIIPGLISILGYFAINSDQLSVFVAIYAIFDGGAKCQMTVVILLIAGQTLLPEAFTLIMFFQTFTLVGGPVLVGHLSQNSSDTKFLFYFIIFPTVISAIMLHLLTCIKNGGEDTPREDELTPFGSNSCGDTKAITIE